MKSSIQKTYHKLHSLEWFEYRKNGIGSSEVAAVMGLNPMYPAAKLFNEKIGRIQPWTEGNVNTFWGLQMEDKIRYAYQYTDPDKPDSYVENEREGKMIRKCRSFKGYYANPDFPHLFTSLDFMLQKGQFILRKDRPLSEMEYPVEAKNMNAYALNKWETVPVYYIAQVMCQCMILETDYAELVIKDSNNNLHIWPVEYSPKFGQEILDRTAPFWENVTKAKALYEKACRSTELSEQEDLLGQVDMLEPGPDNTKAYEDFMKDKFKDSYERSEKQGDTTDILNATKYDEISKQIKKLEGDRQEPKNLLIHSMGKHEILNLGMGKSITYFADKNGKRTFRTKLEDEK